jgi:hypothetical protein
MSVDYRAGPAGAEFAERSSWLVDLAALAHCRELLSRSNELAPVPADGERPRASHLSFIDVPLAYDQFCRTHFTSVRRLHPEISWDDACPAYAVALFAHALLCVELDDEREKLLEQHWPAIRGESTLAWPQARSFIADGCKALARLDPIARNR